MPFPKAPITGSVVLPDGQAAAGLVLTFHLSQTDTSEGFVVLPAAVVVVMNGTDLPVGVELYRNTAGLRGTITVCTAEWVDETPTGRVRRGSRLGQFQVGDDAGYNLADLLDQVIPEDLGAGWYQTITQGEANAVFEARDESLGHATAAAADRVQTGLDRTAAEAARDKAQDWSEGEGTPGGPGTKSAKGHASDAAAQVGLAAGQVALASIEAVRAEAARDASASVSLVNRGWVANAAALSGITSPVTNDRAMTLDDEHVHRYDGSAWVDEGVSPLAGKTRAASLTATVQSVGYQGSIPSGSTTAGTGTFALTTPVAKTGRGLDFTYRARGTGTVYALVLSREGNTVTVEDEAAVAVTPGERSVTLPELAYSAGQFLGWRGPSGLLDVSSGVPTQGFRLWSTSSLIAKGGTYSAPTSSQSVPHFRFDLTAQVVTGPAFMEVQADAALAAMETGGIAPDEHLIGRAGAPVTGSGVGGSTYVYSDPAPHDMILTGVDGYILTAGSMVLKAFDGDPALLVQDGADQMLTWGGTGSQSVVPTTPFILRAGQRLGFYRGSASIAVNSGGPDSGGVYFASGNVPTLTSPSLNAAARIELAFRFDRLTLDGRVSLLEAGDEHPEAWEPTSGFIIALIAGQSNAAGRGSAVSAYEIEAGRGYHWSQPGAALVHLEDPTGNDSIALTGRASIGPSLAHAILAATNGRIGVILVNAAVGSTAITSWLSGTPNWTAASGMWSAAIADAVAKKLPIIGCCGLWLQGEQDTATDMDATTYKGHLATILGNLGALTGCGARVRMIGAMVGANTDPGEDVRYGRIQAGQMALTREDDRFVLGHTGARYFRHRGMMQDTVHYTTAGYDEIGSTLAEAVLTHALGRIPAGLE